MNKVQLFIESHSEHILNRLRVTLASQESKINNDMISSYFFNENFQNSRNKKIPQTPIKESGGFYFYGKLLPITTGTSS